MSALRPHPQQAERLARWAEQLPSGPLLAPGAVAAAEAELERLGWERQLLGHSSAGRPICALHRPGDGVPVVAWGYPHPDEPAGATALLALARGLSAPGAPELAARADWWLVLCADPDQAAANDSWIAQPSLDRYLHGDWRPIYQRLEVDYQFPIDQEPFWQPRSWAPRGGTPPLPESLALADLLAQVRPQLLGLMHGNHASGVYSYLSHRPSAELVAAWDAGTRRLGLQPHHGERPDPGKRWQTARPDLLKERRLADRLRLAEDRWGELEGRRLVGCVSAAQYLESLDPQAVVLTPEVGLWTPPGIGDLTPCGETRDVRIEQRRGRRGLREVMYGQLQLPDGSVTEVCYQLSPAGTGARRRRVALTAGMAGVEAVELRRWLLARADEIFAGAQLGRETLRRQERRFIDVPAHRVNDPSMLIFRTAAGYRRPATVAQVADLRYRWGMQTCLWLGHAWQLYREQGDARAAAAQEQLLALGRRRLLHGLGRMTSPQRQVRSQLSRLLVTLSAVAER